MKNLVSKIPVKNCEQCKYRRVNDKGHYYCHIYELDEDVAFYWDSIYAEDNCHGFNNDDVFY